MKIRPDVLHVRAKSFFHLTSIRWKNFLKEVFGLGKISLPVTWFVEDTPAPSLGKAGDFAIKEGVRTWIKFKSGWKIVFQNIFEDKFSVKGDTESVGQAIFISFDPTIHNFEVSGVTISSGDTYIPTDTPIQVSGITETAQASVEFSIADNVEAAGSTVVAGDLVYRVDPPFELDGTTITADTTVEFVVSPPLEADGATTVGGDIEFVIGQVAQLEVSGTTTSIGESPEYALNLQNEVSGETQAQGTSAHKIVLTLKMRRNISAGGTTSPSIGDHQRDQGSSVKVEAFPNDGYTFSHWSSGISSTNNPYTFTINNTLTARANFDEIPPETHNIQATGSTTSAGSSTHTVESPPQEYEIQVTGVTTSSGSSTHTVESPPENHNIQGTGVTTSSGDTTHAVS